MTLEEYMNRNINKNSNNNFNRFIKKVIITIIITLITILVCKKNEKVKEFINKNLFEKTLNFSKVNKLYNKYILNIDSEDIRMVNAEVEEWLPYDNGALKNGQGQVNTIKNGIVVYIGEKDDCGSAIIIEQTDGVNACYCNVAESNVSIYSYVQTNEIIGTYDGKLYITFSKDGEYLDYKNYIK